MQDLAASLRLAAPVLNWLAGGAKGAADGPVQDLAASLRLAAPVLDWLAGGAKVAADEEGVRRALAADAVWRGR